MNDEVLKIVKEYTSSGRIIFKKHALIRIIEREIRIDEVEEALQNCRLVESYKEDKPFISYLLAGYTKKQRALHIVVAIVERERYLWIITVYEPDRNKWNRSFTRRL